MHVLLCCISFTFLQCFDTVGLAIWSVQIVPEMTYIVSRGTLNPAHSLTHFVATLVTVSEILRPLQRSSRFVWHKQCSSFPLQINVFLCCFSMPQCSHCKRCTCYSKSVRPSVCLFVRLSHAGIVSKRLHVAWCSRHCQQNLSSFRKTQKNIP